MEWASKEVVPQREVPFREGLNWMINEGQLDEPLAQRLDARLAFRNSLAHLSEHLTSEEVWTAFTSVDDLEAFSRVCHALPVRARDLPDVGGIVSGVVKSLVGSGAVVDLGGGRFGHVRKGDLPRRPGGDPHAAREFFSPGERVEVVLLDPVELHLGLRQLPYARLKGKYPVGSTIKGKVVSVDDAFGLSVEVESGIKGWVSVRDLPANAKPRELFARGDDVQALVLLIDVAKEQFKLSIKKVPENR
jgi:hypothetical protein